MGASSTSGTLAYAVSHGGTWTFACSGTITFTAALDVANGDTVALQADGQSVTLSGNNATQLFTVEGSLTLDGLTLKDGHAPDGLNATTAGADGEAGANSGAIVNSGVLDVENSTFADNSAGSGGDASGGLPELPARRPPRMAARANWVGQAVLVAAAAPSTTSPRAPCVSQIRRSVTTARVQAGRAAPAAAAAPATVPPLAGSAAASAARAALAVRAVAQGTAAPSTIRAR